MSFRENIAKLLYPDHEIFKLMAENNRLKSIIKNTITPYKVLKALEKQDEFDYLPSLDENEDTLEYASLFLSYHGERAVWKLPQPKANLHSLFASSHSTGEYVVFIKSRAFYSIWSYVTTDHVHVIYPPCFEDMPKTEKFVKKSWNNTDIPMARIRFSLDTGIEFVNGRHRTLWLLYHKFPAFPVSLEKKEDAELLNYFAGIKGLKVEKVT